MSRAPIPFHVQREHETAALALLTKTETGHFDPQAQEIRVEPVPLPEEEEAAEAYSFLAALRRTGNCLYEPFAALAAADIPFRVRINFKEWYGYTNVFDVDNGILGAPPQGYRFLPVQIPGEDGLYKGYVWLFSHEDSPLLGMIGIRSSLPLFLQRGRAGVAYAILDKVLTYSKENRKQAILVPQPLWAMRDILKRRGFQHVQSFEEDRSPDKLFIQPVCNAGFYYRLDL